MVRWPISIFGTTPARYLGMVSAPDHATAIKKASSFLASMEVLRFRVVAEQIIEAPTSAPAKAASRRQHS